MSCPKPVSRLIVAALLGAAAARTVHAQTVTVTGTLTDAATGEPLAGAHIEIRVPRTGGVTVSDEQGRFRLRVSVAESLDVVIARIGYAPAHVARAPGGPAADIVAALQPLRLPLDPIVVTATRGEAAASTAPAAVSVVDRGTMDERPAAVAVEYARTTPGMDMASKGLIQRTYAVRGERGSISGALLTLTDGRYAELPALALNVPYLVAATDEDLDRVEVVRGPGAALYGPGADRGVLQLITRSPFTATGATATLTAGEREMFGGAVRWAGRLGERFAMRVSAEYLRGRDWPYTDATEQANRQAQIAAGADPSTLRTGVRDPVLERAGGEIRLDWRPGNATEISTTAGMADAIRNVDLAGDIGSVQGQDWRYRYLQARATHGRLMVNTFYNQSTTGDSYALRSGERIVDSSRVAVAQVQHGMLLGRTAVRYGADVRWTDPRTGGTIDGANEGHDQMTEVGAYAYGTAALSSRTDAVAALRLDHHDRLGDAVISPRIGVVYHPTASHAFRLTYNRGFSSPDANALFSDAIVDGGPPYRVRASSVPGGGYTFPHDCGGLCMHSPFAGDTTLALPADATPFWGVAVGTAMLAGVDISGVPAPTAAQVGSVLAVQDPSTGATILLTPGDVHDIAALRRTVTSSFEAGWKGTIRDRSNISVDVYVSRVTDPLGARYVATPGVFYDPAQLTAYLYGHLSPATADSAVAAIAPVPMGVVTPDGAPHPTDFLVLSRQGGQYTMVGVDVGAEVAVSRRWWARGGFSWLSRDSAVTAPGVVYTLNVPRQKAYGGLTWRQVERDRAAGIEARWVNAFPVNSGAYTGRVSAYAVVDAFLSLPLPFAPRTTLLLEAGNILDHRHQEFVGAPAIGRLVVARLRTRF